MVHKTVTGEQYLFLTLRVGNSPFNDLREGARDVARGEILCVAVEIPAFLLTMRVDSSRYFLGTTQENYPSFSC